MDRLFAKIVIGILAVLALSQVCAGCSAPPVAIAVEVEHERPLAFGIAVAPPAAVAVDPPRADLDLPNTCDPLVVVARADGLPRLTKQLPAWMHSAEARGRHQAETRRVVEVVATELGADALASEYLVRKAILESSGNEAALHLLSPDVEANGRAARRARALTSERWARARVPVHQRRRGELVEVADVDAWSLGRGLYGMVSTHTLRWSADAPPWSLCDPVVATVTAIWAIRAGLRECGGKTLRDANRRFSSGRCAVRSDRRERAFDRLARGRVRGLKLPRFDPDAAADFGSRWPEESSDREVLLALLRAKLSSP